MPFSSLVRGVERNYTQKCSFPLLEVKLTSDFRNQLNLHQPLLALQLQLAEIHLLLLAILYLTLKLPFDNMDERSILEGNKPYLLFTLLFELIQQTVTFEKKKIVKAHKGEVL